MLAPPVRQTQRAQHLVRISGHPATVIGVAPKGLSAYAARRWTGTHAPHCRLPRSLPDGVLESGVAAFTMFGGCAGTSLVKRKRRRSRGACAGTEHRTRRIGRTACFERSRPFRTARWRRDFRHLIFVVTLAALVLMLACVNSRPCCSAGRYSASARWLRGAQRRPGPLAPSVAHESLLWPSRRCEQIPGPGASAPLSRVSRRHHSPSS